LIVAFIGRPRVHRQRQPACIDDYMPFAALFAAVRRVRAGVRPPKSARMEALSMTARDQSIAWVSSSSCNNTC
jgi:hypothetical protein